MVLVVLVLTNVLLLHLSLHLVAGKDAVFLVGLDPQQLVDELAAFFVELALDFQLQDLVVDELDGLAVGVLAAAGVGASSNKGTGTRRSFCRT